MVLTVDELSAYLKIPKRTVYLLFHKGRLPGHKVGRALRFVKEEVDKLLLGGIL